MFGVLFEELTTYALPLVCAEVVCETSLKGFPKTCPVNTFGNYPKGDLKQKVGFWLDLSDFGKNVHKLYEKCP